MDILDEVCDLLEKHPNRDKVVSLFSYVLKLWGAQTDSKPLLAASARLAGARAALRMFDNPSALRVAIYYGIGKHEGPLWGTLGSMNCMLSLAYLQAEKLVFLLDTGILKLTDKDDFRARTAHKLFWSLASTLGLIRSLRSLYNITEEMKLASHRKCAPERFVQASLTTTKFILDVVHSVSWLPRGWLWGNRLSVSQASSVATASAVLALVIHYNGKRLTPVR